MTIWFASGIGLSRFVRPVLRAVWPVLLLVVVLSIFVWPWGNRNSAQLKDRYERGSDLSRVAPGQFQSSRDGSKVFFIDRGSEAESDGGRTGRNVFILNKTEKSESVTTAHQGRIEMEGEDRYLVLDKGQRNEMDPASGAKTLARFERYRLLTDAQTMRAVDALPPKALDSLDLLRNPTQRNQGEMAWRLGLAIGGFNLALLGIGMSASNPRRPNNWNLLFALLSFIVYYNMINLSQSWVAAGRMSLGGALLSVHGSALLIALALLTLRDQGNRLGLRLRGARA